MYTSRFNACQDTTLAALACNRQEPPGSCHLLGASWSTSFYVIRSRLCALCWAAGLLTSRGRGTRQAGARSFGCLDSLKLCLGTLLVGFATKKQHHQARHRDQEISNCAEFTNSEAISCKTRQNHGCAFAGLKRKVQALNTWTLAGVTACWLPW